MTPLRILLIFLRILGTPLYFALNSFIALVKQIAHFTYLKRYYYKLVLGFCFLFAFTYVLFLALIEIKIFTSSIPNLDKLHLPPASSSKVYDKKGNLLYTYYDKVNRTPVSFDQIPNNLKLATVVAEDQDFYRHSGISFIGIARAVVDFLKGNAISGGSTITQQLVKNTILTPERTIERKVKEIILAIRLEGIMNKDDILLNYLNRVSYGGVVSGVYEASFFYFNKEPKNLTLSESALLASLTKFPENIIIGGDAQEIVFKRQRKILEEMHLKGLITKSELSSALNEKIKLALSPTQIVYPHVVMFTKKNIELSQVGRNIETAGYNIKTTIDPDIQKFSEGIVVEELNKISHLGVSNAAGLVIEVKTGKILAMVGSKDYWNSQNDGSVNVTTRLRQPGSSIKVVTYAHALSNGLAPSSIVLDTPAVFKIPGSKPYVPKNYEGGFRGPITVRSALAQSRNIPAVRLVAQYGVKEIISQGKKMGIVSWGDPRNYGLSITLGGGETTLLELAQVYSTIANYGTLVPLRMIESINSKPVKICAVDPSCPSRKAIDEEVAFQLIDILSDNNSRSRSFGTRSQLVIDGHPEVAVKTGTSNNLKDNLTVGFNQKYLVAIWVGNNDGRPMSRVASGVTGASSIWHRIMKKMIENTEKNDWQPPSGLTKATLCGVEDWVSTKHKQSAVCYQSKFASANYDQQPNN